MGIGAIFAKLGTKLFGKSAAKAGAKATTKAGTKLTTKIAVGLGVTGGISLASWWSGLTQEGGALEWIPVIPDLGEWLSDVSMRIQDWLSSLMNGDIVSWIPLIIGGVALFAIISVFRK